MITVYGTTTCAQCPTVKRYLTAKGIDFDYEDVTNNIPLREGLRQKTGYSQVPVTTDGKTYVVGFKPAQLAELIRTIT